MKGKVTEAQIHRVGAMGRKEVGRALGWWGSGLQSPARLEEHGWVPAWFWEVLGRWCCGWLTSVLRKVVGVKKIEGLRARPHGIKDTITEVENGYSEKSTKILRQIKMALGHD